MSEQASPRMGFKKEGNQREPLATFQFNEKYVIGVYQGSISEFDILIKYRQRENGKWTRLRTPKHIHWAVDLLIKMHSTDRNKVKGFLNFLIDIWNNTFPLKSEQERKNALSIQSLLQIHADKIEEYRELSSYGEYRVEFLILLAKLLMLQEKTNREDAYMFKKLLDALKKGEDIFGIVSTATHRGR